MTKYDPRKNAEGYNDPTPYAAEKHMMAQIRGKQARVAGGYFENIISASCDYYLSRGLAKIEKTPEPMKPLGAKNRKGQFLACYTKQAPAGLWRHPEGRPEHLLRGQAHRRRAHRAAPAHSRAAGRPRGPSQTRRHRLRARLP